MVGCVEQSKEMEVQKLGLGKETHSPAKQQTHPPRRCRDQTVSKPHVKILSCARFPRKGFFFFFFLCSYQVREVPLLQRNSIMLLALRGSHTPSPS